MTQARAADGGGRELGEQEFLFHLLHRFGGLIPGQVLHIEGTLDPALLREALNWLQGQHPILQAHIAYRGFTLRPQMPFLLRRAYFEKRGTREIALRVVTSAAPDAWRRELERAVAWSIPIGRLPRMRVTLVRATPDADRCQIIITADHAVADAQATNMVSRDLMDYLANPAAARQRAPGQTEIPEPMEARLHDKPIAPAPYVRARRIPGRRNPSQFGAAKVVERRIEPARADALKAAVRAARSTLHGAVSAAFLTAIHDKYGFATMTQLSTVDLKRLASPPFPRDLYGCYIDIVRTEHAIDTGFWAIARDVPFKLVAAMGRGRKSASILKLFGWNEYINDLIPSAVHHRRLDGVAITTAGESGLGSEYGPFRLTRVTMTVSTLTFGPALFVIVSERLGGLDFYVGYASYALDRADAEDLTERAMSALAAVSAETSTVPAS